MDSEKKSVMRTVCEAAHHNDRVLFYEHCRFFLESDDDYTSENATNDRDLFSEVSGSDSDYDERPENLDDLQADERRAVRGAPEESDGDDQDDEQEAVLEAFNDDQGSEQSVEQEAVLEALNDDQSESHGSQSTQTDAQSQGGGTLSSSDTRESRKRGSKDEPKTKRPRGRPKKNQRTQQ